MDAAEILKDVVAYVEVRSNSDNRSAAVCRELETLGAKVATSFTDDVTHVVYKEGLKRTYLKAQKKGIPLVSVSWLESCKRNQLKMPEQEFAALVEKEPDNPLIKMKQNRRWKKMKSMQPCDFDEEVAKSAERTKKQRRRIELANRFKLSDDITPPGGSPALVLALETQARSSSPFLGNTSRFGSGSPLQSIIPDTPTTPTMKERIEKMRREQRNAIGAGSESPRSTILETAVLQRRLFEKLAKDIFSVEDSSDEEDGGETTARVVAKLIEGLESQGQNSSSSSSGKSLSASRNFSEKISVKDDVQEIEEKELAKIFQSASPKNPKDCLNCSVNEEDEKLAKKSPRRSCQKSFGNRKENDIRRGSELVRENRYSTGSSSDESFVLSPMCANQVVTGAAASKLSTNFEANTLTTKDKSSCEESTPNSTKALRKNEKECLEASLSTLKDRSFCEETTPKSAKVLRKTEKQHLEASLSTHKDKNFCEESTPKSTKAFPKTRKEQTQPKIINKRKLFSDPLFSVAVLPIHDKNVSSKQSSEAPSSKTKMIMCNEKPQTSKSKKKRNTEAAEVSFLFSGGDDNKKDKEKDISTTRRRSKRLSLNAALSLSSTQCTKSVNVSSVETSKLLSMTDANTSTLQVPRTRRSLGTSMSVLYGVDSTLSNSSLNCSSRRSLDEFSIKPANLKRKIKVIEAQSNTQNSKRTLTSFDDSCLEKHTKKQTTLKTARKDGQTVKAAPAKQKKIDNSLSDQKQDNSGVQTNDSDSGSDSVGERLVSPLRHANSLIIESTAYKNAGRGYLCMVMTSLHRQERDVVHSVIKKLGVFKLTDNVETSTTHLVCGEPRRTLNLLRAIARGCWILSKEWVFESLEAGGWLMEENYEMEQHFPAAKETRLRRQALGKMYTVDLFSHISPIYVSNNCIPPRHELVNLITLCSGNVTISKKRASLFLGMEPVPNNTVIKPTWVLDSIMKMSLQDCEDYIISPPTHRESSPEF